VGEYGKEEGREERAEGAEETEEEIAKEPLSTFPYPL